MKTCNKTKSLNFVLSISILLLFIGCTTNVQPIIVTAAVNGITSNSAIGGGLVTSDGGATVTSKGICWSTTAAPTVSNNQIADSSGSASFSCSITGLSSNTMYHVRTFVIYSGGTLYGNEVTFTTSLPENPVLPTLTTTSASTIGNSTATSGGNIASDGGAPVTARGICWSTTTGPTVALTTITSDGTGTGTFISNITGLTALTTYYVRAYATNSVGTVYGNEISFTTIANPTVPTLTTVSVGAISSTTAISGGNISSDGGAVVTARGICWSTTTEPTVTLTTKTSDGTGIGTFTSNITGLTAFTTYYVRAYATNSVGTVYGNETNFTTGASAVLPTLTTTAVSAITTTTATCGGNITSDGGATVTARGICWSTSSGPTVGLITKTSNGTDLGAFTSSITGFSASTVYYARAYATNSVGTAYGNEISFTTSAAPAGPNAGTLTISTLTTSAGGGYSPRNIVAIWIKTSTGTFVKSLLVYANARKADLTNWVSNTAKNTTDATTGATQSSHATRTCTWNATNVSGIVVANGDYKVCMELCDGVLVYKEFTFTKGATAVTLTPANVTGFSSISIKWVPN